MTPDQIAGDQTTSVALTTRLLKTNSEDGTDIALVSGTRRALRFVADLLNSLADSPTLPADYSIAPHAGGQFHFDPAASLGLYLECTPELDDADSRDHAYATVWVFLGSEARRASGVFRTELENRSWIERNRLSGTLTEYPVGDGCYDIAVRRGSFRPTREHHGSPQHVAGFSPGWTRHLHYEDGHTDQGDPLE